DEFTRCVEGAGDEDFSVGGECYGHIVFVLDLLFLHHFTSLFFIRSRWASSLLKLSCMFCFCRFPTRSLARGTVLDEASTGVSGLPGGLVRTLLCGGCVGGGRRPIGRCRLLQRCRSLRVRRCGASQRCAVA